MKIKWVLQINSVLENLERCYKSINLKNYCDTNMDNNSETGITDSHLHKNTVHEKSNKQTRESLSGDRLETGSVAPDDRQADDDLPHGNIDVKITESNKSSKDNAPFSEQEKEPKEDDSTQDVPELGTRLKPEVQRIREHMERIGSHQAAAREELRALREKLDLLLEECRVLGQQFQHLRDS